MTDGPCLDEDHAKQRIATIEELLETAKLEGMNGAIPVYEAALYRLHRERGWLAGCGSYRQRVELITKEVKANKNVQGLVANGRLLLKSDAAMVRASGELFLAIAERIERERFAVEQGLGCSTEWTEHEETLWRLRKP